MDDDENIKFYNETLKRHLEFDEVVEELIKYIESDKNGRYKITVGTDSNGSNNAHFVTAIAVIKEGNGGRYFWAKTKEFFCPTLRDRIFKETMRSIAIVQELRGRLKEKVGEEYFWDDKITVHLDVGNNGETKDFVDTVVGMVKGYGLTPIIKPFSFGASVLADRHT